MLLAFSFIDLGSKGLTPVYHIHLQSERDVVINLAKLLSLNHNWRLLYIHNIHRFDCLGFVWNAHNVVWRHYGDCLDYSGVVIGIDYNCLAIIFGLFQRRCWFFCD